MTEFTEDQRRRARAKIVARVKIDPETRCWEWQASCDTGGYAKTMFLAVQMNGHKLSHIGFNHESDPLTEEKPFVLHRCLSKSCVNPDHLRSGTHEENMADRERAGRTAKGVAIFTAKLDDDLVRSIRKDSRSNAEIGRDIGVHRDTVRRAKSRINWRHVN